MLHSVRKTKKDNDEMTIHWRDILKAVMGADRTRLTVLDRAFVEQCSLFASDCMWRPSVLCRQSLRRMFDSLEVDV